MSLDAATTPQVRRDSVPGQPDMWYFVLIETLIFSAYFIVYMVCRMRDPQLYLDSQARLSQGLGMVNTLVLLISSWLMARSVWLAREGRHDAAARQVLWTAGCGGLFAALKILEWSQKLGQGLDPTTNEFFAFYFFLTAIHVVHIAIGFVFLGYCLRELRDSQRRSQEFVETCATYWHMVDFLWVFIFALLYVMR